MVSPGNIARNTFLTNRFFVVFGVLTAVCAAGFLAPVLFRAAWVLFAAFAAVTLFDAVFILRSTGRISLERELPKVLPLGDPSTVAIRIRSSFPYVLLATLVDEWPEAFQKRDFRMEFDLRTSGVKQLEYRIRPVSRGLYRFGKAYVFTRSVIGLVQFRHVFDAEQEFSVFPSVLQMKRHELAAIRNVSQFEGMKKIRRLGHSYEFEQIKNYVLGDDHRSVNWKATGRKGELMVNQYGDERSQQIYSVIDKSRVMKLPFNGLSLMDYAVNTALVISNIALRKHDRAGLVTFGESVGTIIKADNRSNQLRRIMESLYREKESSMEANYQLLYTIAHRLIRHRSLVILYTNFESDHALDRVIPLLRRIARRHLLLVVFFENSELSEFEEMPAGDVLDIYSRTMAGKFRLDKKMMVKRLNQYGIQAILTRPEDLSMNTVNKYLEFKSRGLI